MTRTKLIALAIVALIAAPAIPTLASHLHRHGTTMTAAKHTPLPTFTVTPTRSTHTARSTKARSLTAAHSRVIKTHKLGRSAKPMHTLTHHAVKTVATHHKLHTAVRTTHTAHKLTSLTRHKLAA